MSAGRAGARDTGGTGTGGSGDPGPLPETPAARFFAAVCRRPWTVVLLSALWIAGSAAFLPTLERDTSVDAFTPHDHPAFLYRQQVIETFGLSDPMVVVVVRDAPGGVFTPRSLALIDWLTARVREIPGVDPDRVTSLATEKNITGSSDELLVERFFEAGYDSPAAARAIGEAVLDMPLYAGRLVAADGRATAVVAELLDEDHGQAVYEALLALAAEAPLEDGAELHVAGEGAVNGYVNVYANRDAARLNPIALAVVLVVLFAAYRTLRGVGIALAVVVGAVAVAIGSMAAAGVPFYSITNALTVILMAVGVADAIHILGQYYRERARRPAAPPDELVVRTMVEMWRPVLITSLTTVAGFLSLGVSSFMPPMWWFGVFASVGVMAALVLSLFLIPAVLVLLPSRGSPAFREGTAGAVRPDLFGRLAAAGGGGIVARPRLVLALSLALAGVAAVGLLRVRIDDERATYFREEEPIYRADRAINRLLAGTTYLDIVIETSAADDLYRPEHLRRIADFQRFLETLPHVKKTVSIADYLKQMNRAMHENRRDFYRIPERTDLVAQYVLLYSAGAGPTDLQEEVDTDFRLANLRVIMDSGRWSHIQPVVEAAQRYVDETFAAPGIEARLAGRANLDYHRAAMLRESHPVGVALAFVSVALVAALAFRSLYAGLLCVVPVAGAVLTIYAVMGFGGILLGISTSMTAAITIGVAVDFSVHTLDRLIELVRGRGHDLDAAFADLYPLTGRAIFFNFAVVALGFSVLMTSIAPRIVEFGFLVVMCILASFVASLTLLPALVRVLEPGFLRARAAAPR